MDIVKKVTADIQNRKVNESILFSNDIFYTRESPKHKYI